MLQTNTRTGGIAQSVSNDPARVLYLRQVFQYLFLGLLTAAAGTQVGMMPPVLRIVASSPWLSLFAMIGLVIWASKAANGPRAGIAYYTFSFFMGLIIAPVIAVTLQKYNGLSMLFQAGLLTSVNVLALGAYAWTSKRDFSFLGGFLMTGLITIILASLLNAFWLQSSMMGLLIPIITVFLFNGFILYDLSRILNSAQRIPPTAAALALFLDIFNLFMAFLRILDRD